jgi:predicted ATP-binding protein involved in virulence
MKIERLVLKNFSAVKNAMKANEVAIDFTSSKNNICLIIGPNGSGKTTILSMLHPFSDLGNLDVRNTNNLILDKKDGYKEIIIRKNEDLYTIKHFYTYHTSKSRNYFLG